MSRILLVSVAPGPYVEGTSFLGTLRDRGTHLAGLCGLSLAEMPYHFDHENLLAQSSGRGSMPIISLARRRAKDLQVRGRTVVLLGHMAARAFGLADQKPFQWTSHLGATMAWMPMPSGTNAWYDAPTNRAKARAFLESLVPASPDPHNPAKRK